VGRKSTTLPVLARKWGVYREIGSSNDDDDEDNDATRHPVPARDKRVYSAEPTTKTDDNENAKTSGTCACERQCVYSGETITMTPMTTDVNAITMEACACERQCVYSEKDENDDDADDDRCSRDHEGSLCLRETMRIQRGDVTTMTPAMTLTDVAAITKEAYACERQCVYSEETKTTMTPMMTDVTTITTEACACERQCVYSEATTTTVTTMTDDDHDKSLWLRETKRIQRRTTTTTKRQIHRRAR
jgi:hypothetical protein